jgi:hypothetical protein
LYNTRTKLIIGLFVLAIVSIVSALLPALINSGNVKNQTTIGTIKNQPATFTATLEIDANSTPSLTIDSLIQSSTNQPHVSCIHTVIYWNDHTELWPARVRIGSLTYTKNDGVSYFNSQSDDLNTDLFIQIHTAFLNLSNGAENSAIENTIALAANWLYNYPVGKPIDDSTQKTGLTYETELSDYNNGKLGPALCTNETIFVPARPVPSDTLTPTITAVSATPTSSLTLTRTGTFVPNWTSLPSPSRTSTPVPIRPPSTPIPIPSQTNQPTIQPTQVSTNTSTPVPTAVPTSVPTAIPTEIIPTAVPTLVPTEIIPTPVPTSVPTVVNPTALPSATP